VANFAADNGILYLSMIPYKEGTDIWKPFSSGFFTWIGGARG
jgi:hypothetical protein